MTSRSLITILALLGACAEAPPPQTAPPDATEPTPDAVLGVTPIAPPTSLVAVPLPERTYPRLPAFPAETAARLVDIEIVTVDGKRLLAARGEILIRLEPDRTAVPGVVIAAPPEGGTIADAVDGLQGDAEVIEAQANAVVRGSADPGLPWADWTTAFVPSDAALYRYQWYLHQERVSAAWEGNETLGSTVKVAVLDTGVSPIETLPHVAEADGANLISPGALARDDNGHGTHMASIIGSSGALWGVAPGVVIVPVKVLDANKVGTEAGLVEGLYHAASVPGVRVINMSLTFPAGYQPSRLLADAVAHVESRGIVMVAAAGNAGLRDVGYPARFPQVIAVGAARIERLATSELVPRRAEYSNYGYALDLVAYGGDLTRDANNDGVPDGILGQSLASDASPSGLYLTSGTSPAAAQVSGAVALLLDAGVPAAEVRCHLQVAAARLAVDDFDMQTGRGLLQIDAAMPTSESVFDVSATSVLVLANPQVVFERFEESSRAVAIIEVTDGEGAPLPGHRVMVHFGGDVAGGAWALSDADGVVVVRSNKLPSGSDGVVVVTIEAVVDPASGFPIRPAAATRMDRLSYELVTNLGTGLISSAIVFDYSDDAWVGSPYVDSTTLVDSFVVRALGPGTGTSAIAVGVLPEFYRRHGLADRAMVFETEGTGLISSAIILDEALFNPALASEWGQETLLVRQLPPGSPIADQAIIGTHGRYRADAFFNGNAPVVLLMNAPPSGGASAILWNRHLLAPTLYRGDGVDGWHADVVGTGVAASARCVDYGEQAADDLGVSWASLVARFDDGRGAFDSAIVGTSLPTDLSNGLFGGLAQFAGFTGSSFEAAPFSCPECDL